MIAKYPLQLGETTIVLEAEETGRPGPIYLNLHEDEATSVRAARVVLPETGGRLLRLVQRGARNVRFRYGGRSYTIDPNRVFTPVGARRTLIDVGGVRRPGGGLIGAVVDFGRALLAVAGLTPGAVLIALHNNTDKGGLTFGDFVEKGKYARDAAAVWPARKEDLPAELDDFYLVTTRADFDALLDDGGGLPRFPVVLQRDDAADDGSLSVYCGSRYRYVNVEAQRGHEAAQQAMLRRLAGALLAGPAPRAAAETSGEPASAFLARTAGLSAGAREREILRAIDAGNVPSWTWARARIDAEGRALEVMPDFLAVGTDADFVRVPLTPAAAAAVLRARGLRLPTRREARAISVAARRGGGHVPFRSWRPHDGHGRASNRALAEHHAATERARGGRTGLLDGHMKYVLGQVHRRGRERVVLYGGWRADETLVQPYYAGHWATYVDYSHGIRGVAG